MYERIDESATQKADAKGCNGAKHITTYYAIFFAVITSEIM